MYMGGLDRLRFIANDTILVRRKPLILCNVSLRPPSKTYSAVVTLCYSCSCSCSCSRSCSVIVDVLVVVAVGERKEGGRRGGAHLNKASFFFF